MEPDCEFCHRGSAAYRSIRSICTPIPAITAPATSIAALEIFISTGCPTDPTNWARMLANSEAVEVFEANFNGDWNCSLARLGAENVPCEISSQAGRGGTTFNECRAANAIGNPIKNMCTNMPVVMDNWEWRNFGAAERGSTT